MVRPVAVVTGSSSGIGRETACQFAIAGYAVVIHFRRNIKGALETANHIIREAKLSTNDVLLVSADVANEEHCWNLVQAAFAWKGHVQAWVNNAGADILTPRMQSATFEERLRTLLEVDVLGTIRVSRLVAERMLRQAKLNELGLPSIINIGWDQSNIGMEGDAGQSFCPAKAAVMAFTKSLGLSLGPDVRVNCVAPGWIQTEWGTAAASEYWSQRATSESQLRRWGQASDVANAAVWLASSNAEFVNGQTIEVNGGRRFYPL